MTTIRKEFSAEDANPVVLYGKDDADSRDSFPITRDFFSPGFQIPTYDRISITYSSGLISVINYIASGSTIAIIGITYSSGLIEDVIRTT